MLLFGMNAAQEVLKNKYPKESENVQYRQGIIYKGRIKWNNCL